MADAPSPSPAVPGVIGRWTPLPADRPYPGWDGVKAARLGADPCPRALGAAAVNAWVNARTTWVADPERWQTPAETLARAAGDCKDYAVLKRAILLAKGLYAEPELVLVVGLDLVQQVAHAVLWTPAGVMDDVDPDLLTPAELLCAFAPELGFTGAHAFVYGEQAVSGAGQ